MHRSTRAPRRLPGRFKRLPGEALGVNVGTISKNRKLFGFYRGFRVWAASVGQATRALPTWAKAPAFAADLLEIASAERCHLVGLRRLLPALAGLPSGLVGSRNMGQMSAWKAALIGVAVGLGGAANLAGCDPPPLVGRGGECNSLSDCKPGLVCIEERCTDEIDEIAGEVPVYAGDAGVVDGG